MPFRAAASAPLLSWPFFAVSWSSLPASTGRALASSASSRCAAGPRIRVLQVGANDFDYLNANDQLQQWLVDEWQKPPGIEAVLIEPNPHVFRSLSEATRRVFGDAISKQIRLLNCAVCPDRSGSVTFWGVSPQFAIDEPDAPHWKKYQLSSLNRYQLYKHGLPEKYHEPINVSCYTPGDLLAQAGYGPQEVDILYIDAEGFDGEILKAFLQIQSFSPSVIKFECTHLQGDCMGPVTESLVLQLKSRDYIVESQVSDQVARSSRLEHVTRVWGNADYYRAACKTTATALVGEPKPQIKQSKPLSVTLESLAVEAASSRTPDHQTSIDTVVAKIAQLQTTAAIALVIGVINLGVSVALAMRTYGSCCKSVKHVHIPYLSVGDSPKGASPKGVIVGNPERYDSGSKRV